MMDPEVSVLLHCAAWSGLLESQVHVELSERQTDPSLECQIEALWTDRVTKEPWLFNGAKFRLHSYCLASLNGPLLSSVSPEDPPCTDSSKVPSVDCVENQQTDRLHSVSQNRSKCTNETDLEGILPQTGPILTLRLGITCYKDYLGTNWSSRVAELCQIGEVKFSDPLALLSQPLGVGAVLCTVDGQVVLIRRSQRVAEAGGLLDIPGGHPEPKVVCERLGQKVSEELISVSMMQQKSEAVVSELFSSVCAEIRDEVNIPLSSLGQPILMGVALNHTSAGRPSAEFYVRCSITSDEVRQLYWKGGAEAHESTDIVFLSRTEVLELNSRSPLWSELCPSAKGAVLLFQTVKPG
ncbi:uridine diphosphate glucose pyrophosphatase NUDT22 isoform X2 [Betta splendens]|uniref:Uridine diphosphate glucose pyrophosphatase NUDT22 isoform X2 n=1 Tax=Betta splendens TaxID=158456 RepID=A0A6P7NRF6_BETSP|nr:uridine diphosphate glucose pyrophosphatase NUDT22 isoform X2 [Betta splendens]